MDDTLIRDLRERLNRGEHDRGHRSFADAAQAVSEHSVGVSRDIKIEPRASGFSPHGFAGADDRRQIAAF